MDKLQKSEYHCAFNDDDLPSGYVIDDELKEGYINGPFGLGRAASGPNGARYDVYLPPVATGEQNLECLALAIAHETQHGVNHVSGFRNDPDFGPREEEAAVVHRTSKCFTGCYLTASKHVFVSQPIVDPLVGP